LSAEDSAADTLRPRAEAAGADLDRLVVVAAPDGAPMRFPADLPALEAFIRERGADLVVIDPVMAFLPPEVASNNDQCVRRALTPLARLAERTDCTVLLVRHLRKQGGAKAVYRGLGSVGIIGASRAALMVAVHPADPTLRVLAMAKPNLAGTSPPLGFRLRGDSSGRVAVEWSGPLDISADALGLPPLPALRPRDRASDWLSRELANGPRKAAALLAAAAGAGIPERTLKRAKIDLGVKSQLLHHEDDTREWYWYDPGAPWPKDAPFKKPFELAPLPPLDPL
jgi:hypothetical protein